MVTPLQDYKFLNKGWISMKHLGVLLLPSGQDASPMQGYPPAVCCRYPFTHPGEERQSGVKFLV